jgi:hypothetical protein
VGRQRHVVAISAVVACAVVLAVACEREEAADVYSPGLGEIMTLTQMRHAKLWLAARAGNWPLAAYEVDELEEGLHDAVAYHPTHKDSPVSIAEVIPIMTGEPLEALRAAIGKEDVLEFTKAFDSLTAACNSCHQATNFGFNVVTRPTGSSFLNQDFAPPRKGN